MTLHEKLVHAATEYDRKQSTKRHYNPYAIGHYFNAISKVHEDMDAGKTIRQAILLNFNGRLCDHMLKAVGEPKFTRDEMLNQPISR